MVKRVVSFALVAMMLFGLIGCGKAEEYDFNNAMVQMETYFEDQNNIVEPDVSTFSSFCDAFYSTKFRLRGMVSKVDTSVIAGTTTFYLIADGLKVYVFLENIDQGVKEGEYIEIVGEVLSFGEQSGDRAGCTIHNASIVERGSSVRERIENQD